MDDLNNRLEDATVRVAHLLQNPGLRDLSTTDREVFIKKMIELDLRNKEMDLEEKQLSLFLRRYRALVKLGVELDVVILVGTVVTGLGSDVVRQPRW